MYVFFVRSFVLLCCFIYTGAAFAEPAAFPVPEPCTTPTLSHSFPADGATNVKLDALIALVFEDGSQCGFFDRDERLHGGGRTIPLKQYQRRTSAGLLIAYYKPVENLKKNTEYSFQFREQSVSFKTGEEVVAKQEPTFKLHILLAKVTRATTGRIQTCEVTYQLEGSSTSTPSFLHVTGELAGTSLGPDQETFRSVVLDAIPLPSPQFTQMLGGQNCGADKTCLHAFYESPNGTILGPQTSCVKPVVETTQPLPPKTGCQALAGWPVFGMWGSLLLLLPLWRRRR